VTPTSSTQVSLAWQSGDNSASGFAIEESTDGTTFTQIATASMNASAATVSGLQPSTVYTFRVRAFNTVGNSGYSAPASAATPAGVGGGGLDFTGGFAGASGLQLNGAAAFNGSKLELTTSTTNGAGSAFTTSKVAVGKFSTQFNF
jgi:hypothetical protein